MQVRPVRCVVLGESWLSHHGQHRVEGGPSWVAAADDAHPILRGVGTLFGTTDVHGAEPLPDATILSRGEVKRSLDPASPSVPAEYQPMRPTDWIGEYRNSAGVTHRVYCTTMGAATDLFDEYLRRLVAIGVSWVSASTCLPGWKSAFRMTSAPRSTASTAVAKACVPQAGR
jgi:hypothetical protein